MPKRHKPIKHYYWDLLYFLEEKGYDSSKVVETVSWLLLTGVAIAGISIGIYTIW